MDFLKLKKFRNAHKPNAAQDQPYLVLMLCMTFTPSACFFLTARLLSNSYKSVIIDITLEVKNTGGKAPDLVVLGTDLIRVIESSILCFRQFIKMDKKKSGGVRGIFGGQNQMATPVQQVQYSLEKKAMKVKELLKRSRSYKKKSSPTTAEDVELLLGLIDVKVLSRVLWMSRISKQEWFWCEVIDIKVLSRVLRMSRISKQEWFWCEEKMKKLCLSNGNKFQRDPSPVLFPC